MFLVGCGGHKQARVAVPPPPAVSPSPPAAADTQSRKTAESNRAKISVPPDAKVIFTQTGSASWYGPPYHNRRSSNGEVYDMHAFTAAHRTLPLGSIVRVTNIKTGHSAVVRITDRGPFVGNRIIDLSLAAAQKIDVWKPGVATVKLEVLQTPAPLDVGGRWAVQIGAFEDERSADELAGHISRRYHSAQVQHFPSPAGNWWVRVRVQDDDRKRAEEVARATETKAGAVFLVRLD
jgi:peptidoglycan lytic transglycosylase